ncbi:transmembrane protease serine 11D-like [Adelges cooleyi]|uniref:transmembrane protease serine 11D-like n=1 Tax=Adelges cooleyi TaxID=133065 RepID=UPI00217F3442|nr:transmembrane protease serine 11D-like [Adelges cooleyi]
MDFNVKKVIVHYGYKAKSHDNDIALIQLETNGIPMNPDLHSVCMPTQGVSYAKQTGVVAGWGFMTLKPRVLKETVVSILSNKQCNAIPTYTDLITKNMICVDEQVHNGEVVCRDDSGSSLVINDGETLRIVGKGVLVTL